MRRMDRITSRMEMYFLNNKSNSPLSLVIVEESLHVYLVLRTLKNIINPFGHNKEFRRIGTIPILDSTPDLPQYACAEKRYNAAEKYTVADERYHSAEGWCPESEISKRARTRLRTIIHNLSANSGIEIPTTV